VQQKCLMLGSGHTELKRKFYPLSSAPEEETQWVSLDMNPECNPSILFDLGLIEKGFKIQKDPGENIIDECFDEIHAYEIFEHYGQQGDFKGFFRGMKELWRVLKPGGFLIGTCPLWNAMWAWGDPGHCRVITYGTLSYLFRDMYKDIGTTAATDYRRYIDPCWWEAAHLQEDEKIGRLLFALKKVT